VVEAGGLKARLRRGGANLSWMRSPHIAALLALAVLAAGCSDDADAGPEALVEVHQYGCLWCSSDGGGVVNFDQTTTVTDDGEVSGRAAPQEIGEFEGYEFDDYQLSPKELNRLRSKLAKLDLAALAAEHPPVEEKDAQITSAITYQGETYEIGDPIGEDYEHPPRQAALFRDAMDIVEDARLEGSGIADEMDELPGLGRLKPAQGGKE
jgi:hypothetical protein